MKYIKTYNEFSNNLMIHGKSSDKVLVFDIDDTLIKSNARIFVRKNGEVIKTLNSQEYNEYVLQPDEKFTYEEFEDLNIMLDAELTPYFETMKREYQKGVHISILTARSDNKMIHDFFLKKENIDIHPKLIFTMGDDKSNMSISKKKAKCIKKLVDYGYKILIFFDDNVDNLNEVKMMGDSLGVKIHVIKT